MGIIFDRTTGYWTYKTLVDGKDKRHPLRKIEAGEPRRPISEDVLELAKQYQVPVQTLNPVPTLPPPTEETPLEPWLNRYLERYERDRTSGSLKRIVQLVGPQGLFRRFAKLQGIKTLNAVTVEALEDYVTWRYKQRYKGIGKTISRRTMVSELQSLSGVFTAAVKAKRLPENLLSQVISDHSSGLPRRTKPKYLEPEQVQIFLSKLDRLEQENDIPTEVADLARVLLYTGLRLSAAVHLRWDWIDMTSWIIEVPERTEAVPTKTKTGYQAVVIGDGRKVLERLRAKSEDKTGKVFPSIHRKDTVQRHLSKLGITPHQLRHTFAVACVDKDVPLIVIQDLLGHSDMSTTAIYAKLRKNKKLSVVNGLQFSFDKAG